MYLACKIRSDIVFIIKQFSRHNIDSRKGHLQSAKRVDRYLKRTMQIGLVFG